MTLPAAGRWFWGACLLAALAGCGRREAPSPSSGESAAAGASAPAERSPFDPSQPTPAALQAKLAAYLQCVERIDAPARGALDDYLARVDRRAGPKRPGIRVDIGRPDAPMRECRALMSSALARPVPLPGVDEMADRYLSALGPLLQALEAAQAYYGSPGPRQDGLAQGRAMHAGLLQVHGHFVKASEDLLAALGPAARGTAALDRRVVQVAAHLKSVWDSQSAALSQAMPGSPDASRRAELDAHRAAAQAFLREMQVQALPPGSGQDEHGEAGPAASK